MLRASAFLLALWVAVGGGNVVKIRNDVPRLGTDGSIIDAHSGMILEHNGTFFWYGERYGNTTGPDSTWAAQSAPVVGVYTSTDLVSWTDRGTIFSASSTPCASPPCTQWVPFVLWDEERELFIIWYGSGGWGRATSLDGIHFDPVLPSTTSRFGGQTDGNVIFIDDDAAKTGYIIFSATELGHQVSIERLTADYLDTTKVNVSSFFPDAFVECPSLFKREDVYYVTYGTCCCACREGSGLVVFTAPSVLGPWTRQSPWGDVNCEGGEGPGVDICPGDAFSTGNFTVPMQGYSINRIGNETVWLGNRWLQGTGNNPECSNLCGSGEGGSSAVCSAEAQPDYRVAQDPTYWAPLSFNTDGSIGLLRWKDAFDVQLELN